MSSRPKHFTDSRATNFYYSFLFLPEAKRRAIEAVYAFARGSDDAADNPSGSPAARREIGRYRELLAACYGDGEASLKSPAAQALAEAIRRFQIPRQPFDDLLRGMEMDLRMDHASGYYQTFEELEVYCYHVASVIGLIAIEIFGYHNPQARDYAVNLGKALQMVNIVRDVQTDAQRRRIYLPQEDMDRFSVDPGGLAGGCYNEQFVNLMRFECERARGFFERSHRLLAPEDRKAMKPAEIMGAIYWRLLREIERRSYNVFGERVTLSRPAKLWTAFKVYCGAEWQG
ncbi:MAG: phytoene/squalene synthase family protein [Terriglobia bacterium]